MTQLLPFMLFAFVAAITPGPTNILVLTHGARYGWAAAWPIVLGAGASVAAMIGFMGMGLGEVFSRYPGIQAVMLWAGSIWLSYLAWQIYASPAEALAPRAADEPTPRLGWIGAAGLQLVNPKAWMMALASASLFTVAGPARREHVLLLAVMFFLIALPCLACWAYLGIGAARLLNSARRVKRMNQALALMLLLSVWWRWLP
ncbi:MAG: LysE family translocator [Paludibacterium sp.]|uniref:LysE family translocator n=1 Tax=Paludibacterium sp. TaxID=1917523 RepID=UPI0025F1BD19|nr:LysE family translocator [Paludibacterium sp.]MBV8049086.1 LysE family translocator [Paludibacterium sp.]MBV8649404.1 LysE family translocator [Paludibacterium sp.]